MNPTMPRSQPAIIVLLALWLTPLGGFTAHSQMITAHRGASHDAPENTLAAFELAWKQGADAIEADFYLTSDRQMICIHDADTLRTTGVKRVVAETPLAELRTLDAGSWKGPQFAGEKLPTLGEVLDLVPQGKKFFVELKTGPEIVPVLAAQLGQRQTDPQSLVIIAFQEATVAACKQQLPEIKVHWLTSFKRSAVGRWKPTAKVIAETVHRSGADGVGMRGERKVVDEAFINQLNDLGVPEYHVWTIDSAEDARYFRDLGASGITTNRPGDIRQALAAD